MGLERYKFENYLKEIFFDSDTKIALARAARHSMIRRNGSCPTTRSSRRPRP